MPERKTTSTRPDDTVTGRYDDRELTQRGGSDGKSKALNGHDGNNGRSRTQLPADELGRRAWEATYKNRQKSRRA
jgi:hypothetical protein